jgi:beta-N-acetylhexosaminidase
MLRGKGWVVALALAVGIAAAAWLVAGPGSHGGKSERDRAATSLEGISGPARSALGRMSLREKVDQLFLVGFEGTDGSAPVLDLVRRHPPGGVFIGRANWRAAPQGRALVAAIQAAARASHRPPPLIATDQQGGPYRALSDLPPTDRELDVGDSGSARRALRWAAESAGGLKAAGIDLNLGLVADVAGLDSPVADRAFGDDPEVVAEMTAAAVQGCRQGGRLCAAAHFPGLGAASQDTALGPATVGLPLPDLLRRDLPPFEGAIAARVPAVLLSNAVYAAYDGVTPAGLEPAIATDLLRSRLGFRGAAITDDLGAGAITADHTVSEAAVAALQAGADLLFIRRPDAHQAAARRAVLKAAQDGEIRSGRIDQAAGRVLELKRRAGLLAPGR